MRKRACLVHVVGILFYRGAQLLHTGRGFGQCNSLLLGTRRQVVVTTADFA
ncbi:MAG: hypothetical protein ACMZI0_06285 [Symbiopectobacterium sp.]|uniref:hypothetical protein n=1 Tax=Symbiopectobacterium sp. TaxID=2952789 RepID=UPI0039EAB1AD